MAKQKNVYDLFNDRHFEREIVVLCGRGGFGALANEKDSSACRVM